MVASASMVVKVERLTHRDGVKRMRQAYHRLWQYREAYATCQSALAVPKQPKARVCKAVQGGQP
jgi:hypothetical protein